MQTISPLETAWALKMSPILARTFNRHLNEVYRKGLANLQLTFHADWTPIFQGRPELLEISCAVYAWGLFSRLLHAEMKTVILYPEKNNVVLSAPVIPNPFAEYD